MEKQRSYTQLRPEDRVVIAGMMRLGASVRAMARTLYRSPSTISRELARNRRPDAGYASQAAHERSGARRIAARPPRKLDRHSVFWGVVRTLLDWKWSPQQIAATLKRVYPDEPAQHVSHETLYTAIYAQPRGELRWSTDRLPAPRAQHAPAPHRRHPPAWPDPGHGQHPCAPTPDQRPGDARPLGR